MTPENFDLLRRKAEALDSSPPGKNLLTSLLFLDVIDCMEKLKGMITETEIDLTKHGEHGRVELEEDAEEES